MARVVLGMVRRLGGNRRGGTAIEYGLIAALIVIAMIASLKGLANVTTGMWNNVSTQVQASN
ncbi:MAG: Flp family type IVb pilin [Sphingomonas sp.]|jgi:pilus assembly protein Flp/PilA